MKHHQSSLVLLAAVLCCLAGSKGHSRNIYLLTLLPYPNPDPAFSPSWEEGDNIRPALELAKDQINRNTSLLQNYTLHLLHADGGCQVTTSTYASFTGKSFHQGKDPVTGIIGPGCSRATIHLSSLTNRSVLSLVHVHGSGSPTLANRTLYQYMLGTLGSTDAIVEGFLYLANKALWKKLAVLYDDSRLYYLNTLRLLQTKISEIDAQINVSFLSPASNFLVPLTALQEQQLRVTFLLCPLELARKILCLAYNKSMIYENYQWVIMSQLRVELVPPIEFLYDGTEYKCSAEDMVTALEKALLITYRLTPSDDSALISNTTYEDYLTSYTQYREDYNLQPPRFSGQRNSSYTHWATYLYDAVWAWALVLDNLTKSGGFEIGSEYGNKEQAEMIVEQFYQTRFNGMSGEISFDRETGFVNRPVSMSQVENNMSIEVAVVNTGSIINKQTFKSISDTFPVIYVNLNRGVATFFFIIVIIQFLVTGFLQILTIVNRKMASIKASSPKLLHFSYVGIYIIETGTFLMLLDIAADLKLREFRCQLVWAWCLPIGSILSFVPVAMRTWRVYRIFKHYLNPGPLISDPVLIGGTLLAVLGLLIVSVTWTVMDPFYIIQATNSSHQISTDATAQVVAKKECFCDYFFYWLGFNMGYIISILLLVSVFSFLTRDIPIQNFTTKALRILCYIMTALFLLGFSLFYILAFVNFDPNYSSGILFIVLILMIATYIVCEFLTPLLPMAKGFLRTRKNILILKKCDTQHGLSFSATL